MTRPTHDVAATNPLPTGTGATAARTWRLAVLMAAVAATQPAWAQYKVVAPDGSVTYTDRPATTGPARVAPLRPQVAPPESGLPADLAVVVQRYPVTLMSTGNCASCDAGRALLRSRGVPFNERTVATQADSQVLQRLSGARDLPVLTIGQQVVRGYQEQDWVAYLDAAGYPRTSRLPPGYRAPAATALAEGAAPSAAAGDPAVAPAPGSIIRPPAPPAAAAPAPAPTGPAFRF
jgi:glutaredoxin